MLLPPLHVHVRHLLHKGGKVAISLRPDHEMPMCGHQAVRTQTHGARPQGFFQDSFEGKEVLILDE
jgi:hypothetical protein